MGRTIRKSMNSNILGVIIPQIGDLGNYICVRFLILSCPEK